MATSIPSLLFNAESFGCIKKFSYNAYMDNINLLKSTRISTIDVDDDIDEKNSCVEPKSKKSRNGFKSIDCFFKSFQFAPDGYSAISWTECNNNFQIWDLKKYCPVDLYNSKYIADNNNVNDNAETVVNNPNDDIEEYFHEIQSGESIYDCKWYPYAAINDLSTFCFASSSRDHPIHIWV
jgi:hypothetical protein